MWQEIVKELAVHWQNAPEQIAFGIALFVNMLVFALAILVIVGIVAAPFALFCYLQDRKEQEK